MPAQTTNYGLTKPTAEEFYDVEVQNENMDKIDAGLKVTNDELENHKTDSVPHTFTKIPMRASDGTVKDIITTKAGVNHGMGVAIEGGGTTIIGGGESASTTLESLEKPDIETMIVASDNDVTVKTNVQNGVTNAKDFVFGRNGNLNVPGEITFKDGVKPVSSNIARNIRVGTSEPTGGEDGDIYFQYE